MGAHQQEPPPGTQAIYRTLDVVECFLAGPELGISDIARACELSPSTAHRIVRALVARGYLEQDEDTELYHLGRSAIVLGQAVRSHLGLERVLPILQRLGDETGESVNLGLLDGRHVLVALRVASRQALRFDQPVGSRVQAHCSSMGKAMLAFGSFNGPGDLAELDLVAITATTITSLVELEAEIETVRERGYSLDREEGIVGVSCVGAPVFDYAGRNVAAIAVQGPTARMTPERLEELAPRVIEVARDVSAAMHLAGHAPYA